MHFASRLGVSDTPTTVSSKASAPANKNTASDLIAATLKALADRVTALETETAALHALLSVTKAGNGNSNAVTHHGNAGNALTPAEKQRRYRERKKASSNA